MPAPFFSIIVPVYNDGENLSRCLESIIRQTYPDFECLVIDDGSTDNSPAICGAFSEKDSRITVIRKNNEGTSKTRQLGIERSKGLYTVFVDSDDWVDPDYLASASREIKDRNPDILFFDFYEENAGKTKLYRQNPASLDTEKVIPLVLESVLFSCLWNVILRKEFYVSKGIRFKEEINYGEDSLFITGLLLHNPSAGYCGSAFYHHVVNAGSFTRKNRKNRFKERVKFLKEIPVLLGNHNRHDLLQHNFFPFNDKYEMLSSGVFGRKEYQGLFTLSFTWYYRKKAGIRKYLLLYLAETRLYFFAECAAMFVRLVKNATFYTARKIQDP